MTGERPDLPAIVRRSGGASARPETLASPSGGAPERFATPFFHFFQKKYLHSPTHEVQSGSQVETNDPRRVHLKPTIREADRGRLRRSAVGIAASCPVVL